MTQEEILEQLATILRDVLADDDIVLTMKTVRDNIPGWDSFNYIAFMVAVEAQFGIKFRTADIESFANVGAIVEQIAERKARA